MNRASGSTCSRSPGRQKKRQSSSKPSGRAVELRGHLLGSPESGRKLVNAPSAFSTASRSILPRSAASTIGTGGGGCSSLNPVGVRSPASAGRRKSTVSETFDSGRSNGIPFQPSTIRSEEAPIPSTKRPPLASASAAACWASSAGPRGEDADDAGAEPHRLGPRRRPAPAA